MRGRLATIPSFKGNGSSAGPCPHSALRATFSQREKGLRQVALSLWERVAEGRVRANSRPFSTHDDDFGAARGFHRAAPFSSPTVSSVFAARAYPPLRR